MKHIFTISLCFLALSLSVYGQTPCNNQTSVTYQGYEYDIVEIGGQCWFAENLRAIKYLNNDDIFNPETAELWWSLENQGAQCYHSNDIDIQNVYGNLYNWWAVTDDRGVCPNGWTPPSQSDFMELTSSLGGLDQSAEKLKTTGTIEDETGLWYAPNLNANNSSGFSAIPGGQRICNQQSGGFCYDLFSDIGYFGYFWSSTESSSEGENAFHINLYSYVNSTSAVNNNKKNGLSIRCIKDLSYIAGCTFEQACNFNPDANANDGSCDFSSCKCLDGTVWSVELEGCIVENPTDTNLDGCTDLNDLMDILANYGDCAIFTNCGVIEHEGYSYSTVQIEEQCWFAENCRYIPEVSISSSWSLTDPNYYVYGYEGTDLEVAKSTENYEIYGVLYNWAAAMDGACPSGWHIPSDEEFTQVIEFLGGEAIAGNKMKELGTEHWEPANVYMPQGLATNSSGYTALPGGAKNGPSYDNLGYEGSWWSSSEAGCSGTCAWYRTLSHNTSEISRANDEYGRGYSVRCIKD